MHGLFAFGEQNGAQMIPAPRIALEHLQQVLKQNDRFRLSPNLPAMNSGRLEMKPVKQPAHIYEFNKHAGPSN